MFSMNLILRSLFAVSALALSSRAIAQDSVSAYKTVQRYDSASRVVGVISPDPDGAGPLGFAAVRTTYNAQGLISRVESGQLSTWMPENTAPNQWTGFSVFVTVDYGYDTYGRKTFEKLSGNGIAYSLRQYSYDSSGRLECIAARMNPDVFSSPPASACAVGASGIYEPDRVTRITYDALYPLEISTLQKAYGVAPDTITELSMTYDSLRRIDTVTDANNNTTRYIYDPLGRLQAQQYPSSIKGSRQSNSSDFEQYGYDPNGNRTSFRKRDGQTITYGFDALNRQINELYPAGTLPSLYYGYDLQGSRLYARAGSNAPSAPGISYSYDGFKRKLSETSIAYSQSLGVYSQYDANGNRVRLTYPDGRFFQFAYDGLDRLISILENGTSIIVAIEYNGRGLKSLVGRENALASQGLAKTTYSYDDISRLQSISLDLAGAAYDSTQTFTRNAAGQPISRGQTNAAYAYSEIPSVSVAYTANGLNQYNQITTSTAVSPTADANGNLDWDGSTTYRYNVLNQLTAASGAKSATLDYDSVGRLSQTVGASGTTRFVYDGANLIAEYDSAGNMIARYVHGSGIDEALVWYAGAATNSSARRHLFADNLGSVAAVSDSSGNLLQANTYDPFGVPSSGNMVGANRTRFQYTGQTALYDLGMYYYKARIYSPSTGRFLQVDPIGYKDDMNVYTYVGNDPLSKVDPNGTNAALAPEAFIGGTIVCGPGCGLVAAGVVLVGGTWAISKGVDWAKNALHSDSSGDGQSQSPEPPVPDAVRSDNKSKGHRNWTKPASDDPVAEANKDFDNKKPEDVQPKDDGIRVGTLPDGKRIIVRPNSSEASRNQPTVEIQNKSGSKILDKIRYPKKSPE